MRICILTQPLANNYGGILQAYALQKVLRDYGHEVTTLRFPPPVYRYPSRLRLYWLTFRRWLSKMKGNKKIIKCNPERQGKYFYEVSKGIQAFIDKRIHTLKVKPPLSASKLPDFDLFIVGSDQVWRPAYSPCLPNFYLDFLADRNNVKRIAYAASFGVDYWELDSSTTESILPLIKKFDKVTVREESAIKICREYLGIEADVMPDPTLLLTKDDYLSLADPNRLSVSCEKYIACYVLDENEEIKSYIEKVSKDKGLPVKFLGTFSWTEGQESVEQWLADLAHAEYVITDSFHGTVFSLVFQKEFVTISNSSRGSSRFVSLLGHLTLLDHLIDAKDLSLDYQVPPINYTVISRKLEISKLKGLNFLNNL